MKLRNSYNDDIRVIVKIILCAWLACGAFFGLLLIGVEAAIDNNTTSYQSYCEFAETANSVLDVDGRKFLAENVPEYAEHLNEDGVFEEIDAPVITSMRQFFMQYGLFLLIASLCAGSVISSIAYVIGCDKSYHLADLPLSKFSGWFVLIACWMIWPVFVISRISFCKFREREYMIKLPEIEPLFHGEEFVEFCKKHSDYTGAINQAEEELNELELNLKSTCRDPDVATSDLLLLQNEISQKRAHLNALCDKEKKANEGLSNDEQLLHDFKEIMNMRGVKRIFVDHDGSLIVTVRVLYEYQNALYYIGDFDITIFSDPTFSFQALRTGSGRENYLYGKQFCFGDARKDIEAYLDENRIVEAVELIIESLNHINAEDTNEIAVSYKMIKN